MLMPLSVSASAASDGGLVSSTSLRTLHLNVDHPTRGFLTVGDGFFSMEGLELVLLTSVNPSSQLEELHQQCVSLHLSQNLQYQPKNILYSFVSPSDIIKCVWSMMICGR